MPVSGSPGALARVCGALLIVGLSAAAPLGAKADAQSAPAATTPGLQSAEDKQLEDQLVELLDQKQFDRAVPVAERLVALRQQTTRPGNSDYADALEALAEAQAGAGRVSDAVASYTRAVDAATASLGPNDEGVAIFLNELGILQFNHADYAAAKTAFGRALAVREQISGPHAVETAQIVNNLAQVLQQTGDYRAAEPLLERALGIYEQARGPDHKDVAIALNNLAELYRVKGDYTRAEPLYRRAISIIEKSDGADGLNTARMVNNLGLMLRDKGDLAAARALLERALAIRERTVEPADTLATALNNLGIVEFEQGDVSAAASLYQRALAIAEPALGSNHPLVGQILTNFAMTYLLRGDAAEAEPLYERAIATSRAALGSSHPNVAAALSNESVLFAVTHRIPQAVATQREATDISERNLQLMLATGSEAQKLRFVTAQAFAEESDITISLNRRMAPSDPDATRLALTTVLRRKGRVLDAVSQSLQVVRDELKPDERAWLDQLASVRAEESRLVLRGPGSGTIDTFNQRLQTLDADAQSLESRISERSESYRSSHADVTIEAIQRALPADAVLVEYVVYRPFNPQEARRDAKFLPPHYAAFVLPAHGEPLSIDIAPADRVNAAVDGLRRAIRNPADQTVRRRSRAAYELLLAPVANSISGAARVFIAPDAGLNLLPFAALLDEKGRYLVERQTVSYLTSGRDLLREPAGSPRQPPLVVANPLFSGLSAVAPEGAKADARGAQGAEGTRVASLTGARFTPLPGTAGEASALAALIPDARVLTGAMATEHAVKQVHGPRLLHIATHGFFLDDGKTNAAGESRMLVHESSPTDAANPAIENPLLRSGLAFAGANRRDDGAGDDGILTALELTAIDLWGTRLAVLSACETGVGEPRRGDGVYGLRRALVMAGAESQLMTLWQVSDRATRDLMTSYYEKLAHGRGRADALRDVQLEMLRQPARHHPYYWGSFILSGAAGPM